MSIPLSLQAILRGIINTLAAHVPDVQEFTTAGYHAWVKPANALMIDAFAVAGGGGGGGGGNNLTAPFAVAGSGGGSGMQGRRLFLASDLPDTLQWLVGAGGTGGIGQPTIGNGGDGGLGGYSGLPALWLVQGGMGGTYVYGGRGYAGGGCGSLATEAGAGMVGLSGLKSESTTVGGRGGGSHTIRGSIANVLTAMAQINSGLGGSLHEMDDASIAASAGGGYAIAGAPARGYGCGGCGGNGRGVGVNAAGSGGGDGYIVLSGAGYGPLGNAAVPHETHGGDGSAGLGGYIRVITYRGRLPA